MIGTVTTRVRDERGAIAVIAAISFPVLLLLAALVIDVGNWYTHKRSLQNRADAAALAAGYEYLNQLQNCAANDADDGPGAVALTDVAKQYAGSVAGDLNSANPNNQANITVGVNAQNATPFVDFSDGANPCKPHPVGDSYSPKDGLWTDVKVRETDIGTLAGGFGLNLASVTARARVEMKQLIGVRARSGSLPFVNETGDQVDCAWAQFIDVTDPDATVSLKGTANPVPLTRDPNDHLHWTAGVNGIDLGFTGKDDIGVRYWLGTKTGGGCAYDPTASDAKTGVSPGAATGEPWLDHINIWNDDLPSGDGPPLLHDFKLTGNSCGGPGFLYLASIGLNEECKVNFLLTVKSGPGNPFPDTITVSSSNAEMTPVTVSGSGGTYTGMLTFKPNAVVDPVNPTYLQDYTQVGLHMLQVGWTRTSQTVDGKDCRPAKPCTGTFESGACSTKHSHCLDEKWLHSLYVADPNYSSPIKDAELLGISNSYAADIPGGIGSFTVDLKLYGIDQQRTFLIRDSVQTSGNRTKAIDCGQNVPNEPGLADAILNGCKDPVGVNSRDDVCTTPWPDGIRDCVLTVPGTKQATAKAYMDRWSCADQNRWVPGSSPPSDTRADGTKDPRYAYIFLTSWGRIRNAKTQGEELPIRAFLRVYVTGWDRMGGGKPGPETCAGNEPPPIQYDDGTPSGALLWGHFVDMTILGSDVGSGDVIVGPEACKRDWDLMTCIAQLTI